MKDKSVNLADKLFPQQKDNEGENEILNIPPEQRKLNTETYDFTVSTINTYIEDDHIRIPQFQRGYVWNRSQASRLIESLIIQCPIPVVFLSQNSDETLAVIDGNQRLNSISLFLNDKFRLQGLTAYPELDGYIFSELDPRFKRHILNRTIRCIVILKDTHPQIKFDVFERLNTGSVKLNPQELRHGIHSGKLMMLLQKLAKNPEWKKSCGITNDKRMKSEELILRYFAMIDGWRTYEKPLSGFLSAYSAAHRDPTPNELIEMETSFISTLTSCRAIFGDLAFRTFGKDHKKPKFNAALFDAQVVAVHEAQVPIERLKKPNKNLILNALSKLFLDDVFSRYISQATTDKNAIQGRIKSMTRLIKEIY